MQYPILTNERLKISGFLSIEAAEVRLSDLTTIIGPQASGKSIIAKFFYYFRRYQSDLFRRAVFAGEGRPAYNNAKVDEFFELFGGSERQGGSFEIKYEAGDVSISLKRKSREYRPKIGVSGHLASLFTKAKNDYKRFQREIDEREDEDIDFAYSDTSFDYMRSSRARATFQSSVPTALFIPASRAFFSVIRDEVFTLLSAQKTLDPMMIQFGRFYNGAKRRYDRDSGFRKSRVRDLENASEIIGGRFYRKAGKDFIETPWGEVELPNSSSGQQESLPLIMTLLEYPSAGRPNDLIVIEEPEAHLFPSAQKEMMEMIGQTSLRRKAKILFTTHSPYMLACMNNFLASDTRVSASAYHIDHGRTADIFDADDNLVEIEKLDEVSELIAGEFMDLIDE